MSQPPAPDPDPNRAVHSKATAAHYLLVSRATLDRLIAAGELDVVRVGGQVRILKTTLDAYLARHTEPGSRTDLGRQP